jgi:polysaccharide biosynthesis/export protein
LLIYWSMKPDVRRAHMILVLVIVVPLAGGCGTLRREAWTPARGAVHVTPDYRIACPDVLEVTFADRPQFDVQATVDVDGRLPLSGVGRPRVEGFTADEARVAVARTCDLPEASVAVRVVQPQAARVYVTGPDNRKTRALVYGGPEPVWDFLTRTGSLPPRQSKLNRVYVLRSHVAEGTAAKLFQVDVEAVVLDEDTASNVPLQAGDHVYIGETRRSSIVRLLPDWLKPLYRKLAGLLPDAWK